jgi:molybdate transport system substrate-binding protein
VALIRTLVSPAVRAAWQELAPQFEQSSGHRLDTEWAGIAAIRKRIGGGEVFDLVVGSADSIDFLVQEKRLKGKTHLARAEAGVGMKPGARRPDIASVQTLQRELRAAKKVGYSTGPSGVYLAELFRKWGMEAELAPKLVLAPSGVMVGTYIASGEVEFGFQQKSELLQVPGVEYVGPLPRDIALTTFFTAGLPLAGAQEPAALSWVNYFVKNEAVLRKHGMEPA